MFYKQVFQYLWKTVIWFQQCTIFHDLLGTSNTPPPLAWWREEHDPVCPLWLFFPHDECSLALPLGWYTEQSSAHQVNLAHVRQHPIKWTTCPWASSLTWAAVATRILPSFYRLPLNRDTSFDLNNLQNTPLPKDDLC